MGRPSPIEVLIKAKSDAAHFVMSHWLQGSRVQIPLPSTPYIMTDLNGHMGWTVPMWFPLKQLQSSWLQRSWRPPFVDACCGTREWWCPTGFEQESRLSPATMRCFQIWATLLRPLKLWEGWCGVECWAAAVASVRWQPRVRESKLEERWCQEAAKACWTDGWQQIDLINDVERVLNWIGLSTARSLPMPSATSL